MFQTLFFLLFWLNTQNSNQEIFNVVSTTQEPTKRTNEETSYTSEPMEYRLKFLELENGKLQLQNENAIEDAKKNWRNKINTLKENKQKLKKTQNKVAEILQNLTQIQQERDMKITKLEEHVRKLETELNETQSHYFPENCKAVMGSGQNNSGTYTIRPNSNIQPFQVFCDMTTRGGGWAYVVNRFDGSQDFYLNWEDYRRGFGHLNGEHWMGLEHLYQLTATADNELLFELTDWEGKTVQAHYTNFRIGNEDEGYFLKTLKGFSGDAGDSFSYHLGMKFSTKDKDQDQFHLNCAADFFGAWWHKTCSVGVLTGKYYPNSTTKIETGMHWNSFHNYFYSLKTAKMMIRH